MSAGRRELMHKIARIALGALGAGAAAAPAAGYMGKTNVGVNAEQISVVVSAVLGLLVAWYPRLRRVNVLWKSLTNDDRVAQLEAEIADLRLQLAAATGTKSKAKK